MLPDLTGTPPPGSNARTPDAAFVLDLTARTGQAYIRDELDPIPLDCNVPDAKRGSAPRGWHRFELITNCDLTVPTTHTKLPPEIQNAGKLRYGQLWNLDGDRLTIKAPWAMLGFADPSTHRVGIPDGKALRTQISPGVDVTIAEDGVSHAAGIVTWPDWDQSNYNERFKTGIDSMREAFLSVSP